MNDIAGNGFVVHSSVELLWDDNEPFTKLPFRVMTMVNGNNMCMSHHKTNNEAKKHADKMQAAYLRVHRVAKARGE